MTAQSVSDRSSATVMAFRDETRPLASTVSVQPNVTLRYSIAQASSYSGSYEPHNILYDRPHDLSSRWSGAAVASMSPSNPAIGSSSSGSGATNAATQSGQGSTSSSAGARDGAGLLSSTDRIMESRTVIGRASSARPSAALPSSPSSRQFIILKLEKVSILRRIHFGKFHKSHPCNLRDFRVYGSATTRDPHSNAWVPLLRGGLRNDSTPEDFDLRWRNADGVPFPTRYVKLVPLATHLPNYNFSVWHVALEGVSDPKVVGDVTREYQEHRESTTLRLILKHLRARGHHSAFKVLLQTSRLAASASAEDYQLSASASSHRRPFEHPLVTRLFDTLMQGQWDEAEALLERAAYGVGSTPREESSSLFASYVQKSLPRPVWRPIFAADSDGDSPCGRGGHQMDIDPERGIVWLFGGWDGSRDLADLWAYYIDEGRWRCVSRDVRYQGGPGPRSCHKMVFDPRTGFLYVLGRFVDYDKQQAQTATPSSRQSSNSQQQSTQHLQQQQQQQQQSRGTSPSVDLTSSGPGDPTSARSATRSVFLPGAPGSRSPQDSPSGAANEEIFASGRGGNSRLSSGRLGFLGVDRRDRTPRQAGHMMDVSGNSSPAGSNSRSGAASPTPGTSTPYPGSIALPGYESDFYRFSTRNERWDRLSFDTTSEGGPKLVFDHQMLIDPETQLLYVFGGRVAHPDPTRVEMGGMWKYDVIQRTWTFLFDDKTSPDSRVPSRVGHTMLLDAPKLGAGLGAGASKRLLWILAGQRGQTYLADMWTYDPATGQVREVSKDHSLQNGPDGGFTQRATLDSKMREIYLFSGLVRRSKSKEERVKSAFWIYSIEQDQWRLVYEHGSTGSVFQRDHEEGEEGEEEAGLNGDDEESESVYDAESGFNAFPDAGLGMRDSHSPLPSSSSHAGIHGGGIGSGGGGRAAMVGGGGSGMIAGAGATGSTGELEPRPRYATQMVYDSKRKLFFIFGGNPAEGANRSVRLDDLWCLELVRPRLDEVLRRAKFRLRQQRFLEMASAANSGGPGQQMAAPSMDGSLTSLSGVAVGGTPSSSGLLVPAGNGGQHAGMGAMQALVYLQTEVAAVVQHEAADESQAFRKLMAHLLSAGSGPSGMGGGQEERNAGSMHDYASPSFGMEDDEDDVEDDQTHERSERGDIALSSSSATPQTSSVEPMGVPQQATLPSDEDADMLSVSQTLANNIAKSQTRYTAQDGSDRDNDRHRLHQKQTPLLSTSSSPVTSPMHPSSPSSYSALPFPSLSTSLLPAAESLEAATSLGKAASRSKSASSSSASEAEGRPPSTLYKQRIKLFRALLDFFPAALVEPKLELGDCVELRNGLSGEDDVAFREH